jgi:hypothetical protein
MNRYLLLALFFAVAAFYFIERLWPVGIVLHCVLLFVWLAKQPVDRK